MDSNENSPWTSSNSYISSGLILQFELIQVHDEERLEHRVHKIEDNLCSKEPYLAQLFGTDSLSKDQENQIRLAFFYQANTSIKCINEDKCKRQYHIGKTKFQIVVV